MKLPRAAPVAAGTLALLATSAIFIIQIIVSNQASGDGSLKATAVVSAVLEAFVLVPIGSGFASQLLQTHSRSRFGLSIEFAAGLLLCLMAAGASIATLVKLANPLASAAAPQKAARPEQFLPGCAATFAISFACQLLFLAVHFAMARNALTVLDSANTNVENRRPVLSHVKSIPYSQTSPKISRSRRSMSLETPPSTLCCARSRSGTMSSIKSTITQVVRPISSKSRLLPHKDKIIRRATSLDSSLRAPQPANNGFDFWEPEMTAIVDAVKLKTLDMTMSPPSRPLSPFLETIPASPTGTRTPSPAGHAAGLQVPVTRQRSRSCSPAPSRCRGPQSPSGMAFGNMGDAHLHPLASRCSSPQPSFTMTHSNTSEAHIHPLFRSDSPVPPPAATPGTVVTAAPDAGRVISDRTSIRSLRRMRSGSLPPAPSPLIRHTTFEDLAAAARPSRQSSKSSLSSIGNTKELYTLASNPEERKMTPPVPNWLPGAGSHTSLPIKAGGGALE